MQPDETQQIQQIQLKGATNFRDFGGYPSRYGGVVRRGLLFRSDCLSLLTEADLGQLSALGLRLVCDLRSARERKTRTSFLPAGIHEVLLMDVNADLRTGDRRMLEILRQDSSAHGAARMMLQIYGDIPRAMAAHLLPFFSRIAHGEALPTLIHCSAGKDRTGVLVALLLMVLGVPREQVINDYLRTARCDNVELLRAMVVELVTELLGETLSPDAAAVIAGVDEAYLQAALRTIESDFGSMDAYLESAGVGQPMIEAVRARLLS